MSTLSATIANGASLSAAVEFPRTPAGPGTEGLIRITMPSAWTAANLTFQCSEDGTTFNDFYDASGTEYTVTAAASRSISVPPATFAGMRYLKVRSGTSGTPVNQGAARTIGLETRPL